jgi:hypothetical protein
LDDDVKIWIPSNEDTPALANLKQVIFKQGCSLFENHG